jgi:hypothetical protein
MRKLLLWAALLSGATPSAWAAEPDQPSPRILTLRPVGARELRIEFNYNFRDTIVPPFEKEPAFEGKEIARGLIPTVPPTPLVRNITDRELYLKPDHGRDFTAGPLATYKSQCDDGAHVYFQNLRVSSERESLAIPYTVDLYTYQHGCGGWFMVRSGWTGSLDLDGRSWRLTIVDNLDGRIDAADRLFLEDRRPADGMSVSHECPVPQTLFLGGHCFRLDCAYKAVETGVALEAALTEIQLPMGELKMEANGCRSLSLCEERRILFLDKPEGTIAVPAGRYRVDNCVLNSEPDQQLGLTFARYDREISVQPGQATFLRLGLPLRNTVAVTRDRNRLHLTYQLVGAGGEVYRDLDVRNRPFFRIYKGPLRIAGGTFGFG